MFLNKLKSLSQNIQKHKIVASNNFLSSLNNNDIQEARNKIDEKREVSAEVVYQEALEIFSDYEKQPDINKLESAGKKLIQAIEINKDHIQSYIYLSYVFHTLKNDQMALKYFKIAEQLQPNLPEELIEFKLIILQSIP